MHTYTHYIGGLSAMRMLYAEGLTSPEIEIAEGGTMLDNKSRYAELRVMLDSNREPIKMEAMKRIINMVARGKDVSELFPAVVKNVAVKNLELKKLVYVYLVRYAEEQQDLALLSISTFQRALKDPNQLIRASALRVLSSIRVAMIAPVMLLAIKESVRDMSAYVRKVAAHAIPKLYALDPELQPQLLECIDYLLADKRTLVLGSAVHAFEATCPDRFDLLHRHFRALCRALADVDEWGQIVMIGLLTRYARTQFTSPHADDDDYADGGPAPALDPDHSLLCMSVKPLLQSRNCAVVMAVSQLLYYIAPHNQLAIVPRALVRLLRGPNEVQYVVLVNIATICAARNDMVNERIFAISKNLFEPFLKSFFVRGSDTIHVKQLKLQILTSLVSDTNAQLVIRELQAYLQMPDLAGAAIEAIGRCALQVPSAAELCLTYLINLISSNKEAVVCSAVVVLKRLLHVEAPLALLKHVLRLFEKVKAPTARACVIWLVQTHSDKPEINKLAPDLLRKLAKGFCDEADCVKLQTLNLAVRMWIGQREKCELLVRYVLQLARYDRSYDIRDRCRMLRNFLVNPPADGDVDGQLPLEIFLSNKPAPSVHSQFSDRERFQLGTLSHLLNQKCSGYTDLPGFPSEAPDPSVRRTADDERANSTDQRAAGDGRGSSAMEALESDEEEDDDEEEDEDEVEEDEEEDEEEEEEEETSEDEASTAAKSSSEKASESEEEDDESEEEESEEEEEKPPKKAPPVVAIMKKSEPPVGKKPTEKTSKSKPSSGNGKPSVPVTHDLVDLLGDIDFGSTAATANASYGGGGQRASGPARYVSAEFFRLVSPMNTGGLSVEGRYTRDGQSAAMGRAMVGVELRLSYRNPKIPMADVKIKTKSSCHLPTTGPLSIDGIREDAQHTLHVGVDFGDSGCPMAWTLSWTFAPEQTFDFELTAPFGEQIEPPPAARLSAAQFNLQRAQMAGMHQFVERLDAAPKSPKDVYRLANCAPVDGMEWFFVAQTVSRKDVVLISFNTEDTQPRVTVNCENVTFGVQLCREIQSAFASD